MRYLKMISNKQFLQIFKSECRKYFTYEANLTKEKLDLQQTEVEIQNLRSPITDRVGGHQTTPQDQKLIALIEVKEETERRIAYYESILQWIINVLNDISSPAYKAISWQTLIQGKNKNDVLIYYDVDTEYVYRTRDKFIILALNDDRKREYEETQRKRNQSRWLSLNRKLEKGKVEGNAS